MYTIKCFGNFDYTKVRVSAIVKIDSIEKNDHFVAGGNYPVIYNYSRNAYGIMDERFNLACYQYCETMDSLLKFLASFKGCVFEVAYYIEYTIYSPNTGRLFGKPNNFEIDWKFKHFYTKVISKTGISL